MGIIRLTLLTVAGIGGAMWVFGTDDGVPENRLGRVPEPVVSVPEPPEEPAPDPVAEPVSAPTPEPVVEPAPDNTPEPEPAPPAEPVLAVLYVTGARVNLRAGPNTGQPVVTALTRGTVVDDLGAAQAGWTRIRVIGTGAEGFMASRFLSPDAP